MIDLEPFCDLDSDSPFAKPFSEAGFTFATNSCVIVRVARRDGVAELEKPALATILPRFDGAVIAAAPLAPLAGLKRLTVAECKACDGHGRVARCSACDGHGNATCDSCGHDHDCEDCEGFGVLSLEICSAKDMAEGTMVCPECLGLRRRAKEECAYIAPGYAFDPQYLLLIDSLPNARIAYPGCAADPAYFVFDGGDGLLMPMRGDRDTPKLYDAPARAEAA